MIQDLRKYDQVVELYSNECAALCQAIGIYQRQLLYLSSHRRLQVRESLSMKPLAKLLTKLTKLDAGRWPMGGRLYMPRPRKWRLEFDELLLLNSLYCSGELFVPDAHKSSLYDICGKINQKVQNLTQYFEL